MPLLSRIILLLFLALQPHQVFSADQEELPTITVLPFEVSAEGQFAFLNRAVDQMLMARLSRYQDLRVIPAALNDAEIKALQQELQAGDSSAAAQRLRGQWLVEPSMYSLKEGMQLNVSLIPLQGGKTIAFAEKIESQDQIMAAVGSLAENIHQSVTELGGEEVISAREEAEEDGLTGFTTSHPFSLLFNICTQTRFVMFSYPVMHWWWSCLSE